MSENEGLLENTTSDSDSELENSSHLHSSKSTPSKSNRMADINKLSSMPAKQLLVPYNKKSKLRVYRRRWYILFLFSVLSFMQCTVWNTWGPISSSALAAYPSWTDATIALFGNWGTVTYVVFTLPIVWIYNVHGPRVGILIAAFLMTSGTLLRCISVSEGLFTWTAHIGANLNGIAGVVFCSVPPAISALWFPPNERTTATGIATLFNQLGNAGGFLLGPWLVREPRFSGEVCTNAAELRKDIQNLMYLEASICCLLLLLLVLYFPAKPPRPPSSTSGISRLNLRSGFSRISRNKNILLLTGAYSLSQGVLGVWVGVLNINLEPLDIDQVESGWLGLWSVIISCLSALIIARLTDVLTGRMKKILTVLLIVAAIAFTFLALMCTQLIPVSPILLWLSVIIGSSATYAASPLFFELSAEVAFPVDEAVIGGFMSCLYNVIGAIFLFAFFIPGIGVTWMNYCLVLAPAVAIPFVVLANEEYKRREYDNPRHGIDPFDINAA